MFVLGGKVTGQFLLGVGEGLCVCLGDKAPLCCLVRSTLRRKAGSHTVPAITSAGKTPHGEALGVGGMVELANG